MKGEFYMDICKKCDNFYTCDNMGFWETCPDKRRAEDIEDALINDLYMSANNYQSLQDELQTIINRICVEN